ncbi:hypothetical protein GIY23_05015 [Allosaccharopolyspora coralli]|uniref:SseB protein N-terminal domain-containing protein n=1 Tax=Allosaccharopolyspora coralli TaxID=2665642 RepID=A0A5Q3Q574_9PSEU|nr:SAV_915 family protein [Allosaccharopolyspora coralli]QGK68980.1 hypothetical protein GIY23_05015 [Allosaccharopolyspora coralli]
MVVPPAQPGEDHVVAPAVLGAPQTEVFVPSERASTGDQQVRFELRYTSEGAFALLTYTSLERLVEGCGEAQPWVSVADTDVMTLAEQTGAQVVLQDVPLPDDDMKTTQET